jgi:hypothetical protein
MLLRICQISFLASVAIAVVGCSGNGTPSYNPDMGPFDEDGNYVEAWADNPPKRASGKRTSNPAPRPEPKPEPRIVSPPVRENKPVTRPQPTQVAKVTPKPKPKPRPVVKPKPKPKPTKVKPKNIRHVVKKGDTLYGLAKKYGTTVSAIKRANGLSGSTIQTGKSYIIPK